MSPLWSRLALACAAFIAADSASSGTAEVIFENGFEPLVEVTVEDVQLGLANGSVFLSNRFVTARSADARHLWIADSASAAAWQGVYVYRGAGAPVLGPDIAIGARVNVVGTLLEFDVGLPPVGNTLTELVDVNITLTAAALPLVPLGFVGPITLSSITDGEAYEGVLVSVTDVRVVSTATGNRVTVANIFGDTVVLDDDAYVYPPPVIDTCYAKITGVMHLNFLDDERRLLPRGASDMAEGSACN